MNFLYVSCLIVFCSQSPKQSVQNSECDVGCYLRAYSIDQGGALLENLIKKSEKAFAFKRDSSKYAILHSKGDSIAFIAVVDNQDDYKGWPPEKIISSTQFKVGIEILEALSQLRVYHVQKAKGDVQIFTNELPDVLFLKKNGVLVYSYFGVSSCPSEDEVSKTLLKVFQVIK